MVADDTLYNTPNETALAVVATAMKKARLQLSTLVINSVVGGILFSSGSILTIAAHAENPGIWQSNPGMLNCYSGIVYGIGLFYVVIMGADLFNSNILFFSVGVLRRAVTIYDLLISWSVSLLGNVAGSLFVAYLFVHLSGIGASEMWKASSRQLVEDKASFTFIQTLLKAIAGNFFVCLAIYQQLMAKPIHVRLIVIILPIFTFVSCGFTHAVADMCYCYIGLLNRPNVTVAKYLWKLLVPACIGNIIGGFTFSLVIPFYLHLIVVERDRKRLSLPEYDARDEQPEVNTDSRVVRIPPGKERREELEGEETEEDEEGISEKVDIDDSNSASSRLSRNGNRYVGPRAPSFTGESSQVAPEDFHPHAYEAQHEDDTHTPIISKTNTLNSTYSRHSALSARRRSVARSPPGVFPVRGMGEPLRREKTIENSNYALNQLPFGGREETSRYRGDSNTASRNLSRCGTNTPNSLEYRSSSAGLPNDHNDAYDVLEEKPGSKLEKVVTKLMEHNNRSKTVGQLPRTTQETFPHNKPPLIGAYTEGDLDRLNQNREHGVNGLFRSFSKEFSHTKPPSNAMDLEKRFQDVGITPRAANAAQSVAGVSSYDYFDHSRGQTSKVGRGRSHHSVRPHGGDSQQLKKTKTASIGILLSSNDQPERRPASDMASLNEDASKESDQSQHKEL